MIFEGKFLATSFCFRGKGLALLQVCQLIFSPHYQGRTVFLPLAVTPFWVEAGINNSFSYSYFGPVLQTTPFSTYHPFGVHQKSLYGYHFSIGWNKYLKDKLSLQLGIESLFTGRKTYSDIDSVTCYYDTTGFLLPHKSTHRYIAIQLPIIINYHFNDFNISLGLSIPFYTCYKAAYNNILEVDTYTGHDWLWNLRFPSVFIKLRLGWSFLPKWNTFIEYSKYSNNSLLSSNLYTLGLRYHFNLFSKTIQ